MIENFHNVEIMLTNLPQYGKYARKKLSQCGNCGNKTSTMWKLCQQNFHNVESMLTKLPQCGN